MTLSDDDGTTHVAVALTPAVAARLPPAVLRALVWAAEAVRAALADLEGEADPGRGQAAGGAGR